MLISYSRSWNRTAPLSTMPLGTNPRSNARIHASSMPDSGGRLSALLSVKNTSSSAGFTMVFESAKRFSSVSARSSSRSWVAIAIQQMRVLHLSLTACVAVIPPRHDARISIRRALASVIICLCWRTYENQLVHNTR